MVSRNGQLYINFRDRLVNDVRSGRISTTEAKKQMLNESIRLGIMKDSKVMINEGDMDLMYEVGELHLDALGEKLSDEYKTGRISQEEIRRKYYEFAMKYKLRPTPLEFLKTPPVDQECTNSWEVKFKTPTGSQYSKFPSNCGLGCFCMDNNVDAESMRRMHLMNNIRIGQVCSGDHPESTNTRPMLGLEYMGSDTQRLRQNLEKEICPFTEVSVRDKYGYSVGCKDIRAPIKRDDSFEKQRNIGRNVGNFFGAGNAEVIIQGSERNSKQWWERVAYGLGKLEQQTHTEPVIRKELPKIDSRIQNKIQEVKTPVSNVVTKPVEAKAIPSTTSKPVEVKAPQQVIVQPTEKQVKKPSFLRRVLKKVGIGAYVRQTSYDMFNLSIPKNSRYDLQINKPIKKTKNNKTQYGILNPMNFNEFLSLNYNRRKKKE